MRKIEVIAITIERSSNAFRRELWDFIVKYKRTVIGVLVLTALLQLLLGCAESPEIEIYENLKGEIAREIIDGRTGRVGYMADEPRLEKSYRYYAIVHSGSFISKAYQKSYPDAVIWIHRGSVNYIFRNDPIEVSEIKEYM